ncbi:MAG: 2-hydroxyacyl-CoA dehydratase family protein, partial [Dehalococcoidia bacterium]|nr:2-hydroxyacyl-CoA dehydratase family protein [Dehalococcoidia bacterium]
MVIGTRPVTSVLDRFREVNAAFPRTAEIMECKRAGKKVIGWLCTYVPEEVIHAAGVLPIRITGYSREMELDDGNAYLYINNCSFTRSCFQLGIRGEYDFLDGVVGGSTCDGARRLFDLWRIYLKPSFWHVLTVPRKTTQRAHELYYDQCQRFKEHFEEFLGFRITDEALRRSIEVMNEQRSLMRRLYELRKKERPPVSGAETMEVLDASFRMTKERFNQWLKEYLAELESSDRSYTPRARLMVVGSVLTNADFLRSIEELGALVVTDELCTSTRYWSDPVVVGDGEAPLRAVARRYLDNFPCARMYPSDLRFDRILQLARDFRVDGVI